MKHPKGVPGLVVAAKLAVVGLGIGVSYAEEQPLKRTDLMREALGVAEGMEAVAYVVDAAPGASVDKHRHSGDEFLYVPRGSCDRGAGGELAGHLAAGRDFPPAARCAAQRQERQRQ